MEGIIGFKGLKVSCIVGVFDYERALEQDLVVDLKVKIDCSKCVKTENVEDTVDYVELAEICSTLAKKSKYKLIETFAKDLLEVLLKKPKIVWAKVKIKKPKAISLASYGFVEMEKGKS